MTGLDEEAVFRGILLCFLSLVLVSARINFFGAHLNLAGLILVLLFGFWHGLQFLADAWSFSAIFFLSLLFTVFLLWIRERTGSLVLPILTHNTINLFGQLVPA